MDRIIDRLDKYMAEKGLNDNQVTVNCGLSVGLIGQARKGKSDIGKKAAEKILNFYQDVNRVWFLTGEGDMLNVEKVSQPSYNLGTAEVATTVLLLPMYAHGGSLNDFVTSTKENDCEKVISPIGGVDFAIQVSGDSMSPEYPNGSRIFIKKINEKAFIEWGKTYVLDTCNGTVVKRIVPSDRDGYIKCVSINPDPVYAPFEVSLSDVFGMYKVLLCMSVK